MAILSAVGWLIFPGFGLADLLVTWDPDWAQVLEAGWGLFFGALAATAFGRIAVAPRRCAPALVQTWVLAAALAVSAAAAAEPAALALTGLLVLEAAVVTALLHSLPGREPLRPIAAVPSVPLLVLAVAGAAPWATYAVAMYRANRADAPVDVSVGVDHYAVQGALALALATLALLAAVWPRGRAFLGIGAGVAAGYLGLVSLAWPGADGGHGPAWSALTIAWGMALAALSLMPWRRPLRVAAQQPLDADRPA